jgi:two-component system, OmpR family, phosphate regulon sensor histidine kinase PhoR
MYHGATVAVPWAWREYSKEGKDVAFSTILSVVAMIASAALAVFLLGDADWRAREAGRLLSDAQATIADLQDRLHQIERQQPVWDYLPVGVVLIDPEETIVICNRRAVSILQPLNQQRGSALSDLTQNPEVLSSVRQAQRQRGTVTGALTLAPGMFVDLIAHGLEDGGVLLILQDVSELRLLRTVRRDFVANVSHELRTPLASIRLLVDTLEDGALDEADVAANFVHRIGVETDHLIQMVTELLELSRIESSQFPARPREPAALGELIALAVERLSVVAQDKAIVVTTEVQPDMPLALVDRDQIVQVLMNLLFNAIKFTPRDGAVRVRAQAADGYITVTVSDTGVGIPREDLARIFERFYKSDKSRARSGGGTGLGLPIARHIVESHGGSIRAESQEGQGSAFTFTLPVA